MRHANVKLGLCLLPLALALAMPASAAVVFGTAGTAGIGAPILITQPAYDGMQFYAYRPHNIPTGWYATYDGYPVFKGADGVWMYGSNSGRGIVPTSYVVGSVVPSVVGLVPWAATSVPAVVTPVAPPVIAPVVTSTPHGIDSLAPQTVTVLTTQGMETSAAATPVHTPPPPLQPAAAPVSALYVPGWAVNSSFLAIGNWSRSVDRIGVLVKPALPVAWKGRYPKVIYAWTGHSWYQITLRDGTSPYSALKNSAYDLTVITNKTNLQWGEADMGPLAQYAAMWGYSWMGQILLTRPGLF